MVGGKTPIETATLEPITQKSILDKNFVGREEAITYLNNLDSQGEKVILIHAKGGVGKTTLARNYLKQKFGSYIEFPIAKETGNITPVESLLEERLRQLNEEPGREFGVSLERLRQKLQAERIGVLIDNLEPTLDENGKFIKPHRLYVELLRVLADPSLQSLTLITSRDRLHESDVSVWYYLLEGLPVNAWQQYFNSRSIQTNSPALSAMHNAYGGNAKAMEIIAGAIEVDYIGNVEQYWQMNQGDLLVEADLRDLVTSQLNRLSQQHSPAFKLLCRLGCYRYQDIATVPINGLFSLLWDVPEPQHRRVVNSLRDRSLVELQNGEYWLHPVIREEAISRLRASEDWETANRKAAEFWTESINKIVIIKEALQAFEAYYHYLAIYDFEAACSVIVHTRQSKWKWHNLGGGETLSTSLRRLGLSQKIILAGTQIIGNVLRGISLVSIHMSLAQGYWFAGNLSESFKEYKNAENLVVECLHTNTNSQDVLILNRLYRSLLVGSGICKIDLLEMDEAEEFFLKLLEICQQKYYYNFQIEAYYALAFIYSTISFQEKAQDFANKSYNLSKNDLDELNEWAIGHRYIFLGLTYKNLGDIQKAFLMYNQAVTFADDNHYSQIKARALTGLAELHREQQEFETAFSYHSKAIELLDKIGAKCDLAEAYYQLGLTYQKMEELEKSKENFDKAIRLFREIEAPKQVEKVQRARDDSKSNQIE
ncbi:tetratricopeptide repeat protein [Tolypothrix sp. FACHB-123]|uniref:tetratricopeptide repeat protein n=1 Tax=Tolypothrix sp. FACHB-123 TaxID=2692868 RepID=UPI001F54A040|nr:tetratricopeptide repeat protein [Tolypothrix sp. FACHB-123]